MRISTSGYGHTNVAPSTILDALSNCCNKRCISGFGHFSGMCGIVVRTSPGCHISRDSLGGVFIHVSGNRVTPLDRFIALAHDCKTRSLDHFGVFGSVTMGTVPTRKCDANSTVHTIRRATMRTLPGNFKCSFNNVAHRRASRKNAAVVVFTVYFLVVCLVLDTLCRDFLVPFTILLSIPFKLVNDFLFTGVVKLRGGVCLRANLVVLVNLLTGATVLLARCTARHHGTNVDLASTTLSTTGTHLHPVLVATLAVVFNLFPLVITDKMNTGKGDSLKANAINKVIVNALTLLFVMPSLFVMFRCLRRGMHPVRFRPTTS